MKILYLSPYPPTRDGIGSYTKILVHAVQDAGNEIGVVVPRGTPGAPPEVVGAIAPAGKAFAKLHRTVADWSPDVVHVQFAIAAFGTRTVALMRWLDVFEREFKIPIVITLHELTHESALLPAVGHTMFQRIAARCDQFIVHTDIARNALIEAVGVPESNVTVIPQPNVQPPPATSSPDRLRARFGLGDARLLLAFGFIHRYKGLDDLIGALHILRDTGDCRLDDVRLVIAGAVRPRQGLFRAFEARDKLYLAQMLRRIRRDKLQDLIVLTGYVPDGEVATWFEIAEAVVLPYRRIEHSMVAGLARSSDVPVLSSTVGGLAEQFAGSQWTFPPGAPTRIAETLAAFLAATSDEQVRLPAGQIVADFTSVTARTLALYAAVISKKLGSAPYVA